MPLMSSSYSGHGQVRNQWAWRNVNGNSQNWHAKRKKNEKDRTEYQSTMQDNYKRYSICIIEITGKTNENSIWSDNWDFLKN